MKKLVFLIVLSLMMGLVWGQTTINFDDNAKWTAGSAALTSYAVDHTYVDGVFSATGGTALRNTTTAQDGFPGALGTYAWRLENLSTVDWRITIASGGVSTFSIAIRRWDGTPSPAYNLEYSVNAGSSWNLVSAISNTTLDNSSAWKTFNGSINSSATNILIRLKATGTTERIMVDNFIWTGYSSSAVATPTFDPVAGTYGSAQSVTISTTTSGATIRYTTDGNDPTESSTQYSTPISVSQNTTIKAKAWKTDMDPSGVATAVYVIKAATPTFDPVAGTYSGTQTVTISCTTPSSTIYYTTNGSTPTTGSAQYTGPISVETSQTIKAIATAVNYGTSDVGSAAYTITVPTITVNPTSLTGFTYILDNGPSVAQSFTLTGSNLTNNVSVSVTSDYQIATSESGTYGSSLSYTPSSGSVSASVYVRQVAGLAIGATYTGTVTCSSTGATDNSVSLSGSVTAPPPPAVPVATNATNLASNSFTANWNSASGATGYELDVFTTSVSPTPSGLFISEYIEGSSSNKAIEIYNGTATAVTLTGYNLKTYVNGSSTPSQTITLTGSINPGATYVVANSSSNATILGQANLTSGSLTHNGNDAVGLFNGTTLVDLVGVIADQNWGLNVTLVRKINATVPSTTYSSSDWDSYPVDTAAYLGYHGSINYVSGYEELDVENVQNYPVSSLNPGTTYYYRVRAYNSHGTSADSNVKSVTTLSPTITVSTSSLTGFTYEAGSGPSGELSFMISGSNLTDDISIVAPTNYQISLISGTGFNPLTPLVLNQSGGSVGTTTVYVRLSAGLDPGSYNGETIIASSTGATSQVVTCSGTVTTPPPPPAPVAISATEVGTDTFVANWNSVDEATGYKLDVYYLSGNAATDLFFSEYIEGSSSNKAIEIYNGTGTAVDLSNYTVNLYSNGSSTVSQTLSPSGTLSAGDVFVIANANANSAIQAVADVTSTVTFFDGNDAIELVNTSSKGIVDIFGRIGDNPGTFWGTDPLVTAEKTLVRKATVTGGVTSNPESGFPTLATEWDSYPQNTTSYLGSHTMGNKAYVNGYENLTVNGTSIIVSGLQPNTTYYYVVRATNEYGTSMNSNQVEVTTDNEQVVINDDGSATGATIVTGGSVPESLLGPDTGIPAVIYTITAAGVRDVTVNRPLGFGSVDWYCWLVVGGNPFAGPNPIPALTASYTFTNINFDAKGDVVVIINDNQTLPVELSSFTATLTAHNYVQLTWVTQTETGVQGYYIFRSGVNDLGTAQMVSTMIPATNTSSQQSYIFVDSELFEEGMYYYWLQNTDFDGSSSFHGPVSIQYTTGGGNGGAPNIPLSTQLKAAYPNPFNPSTRIPYDLAKGAVVKIHIYNSRGQLVRSFPIGAKDAGSYYIDWNGKNDKGEDCATGVYYIRMQAGDKQFNSKAVLMK